MNHTIVTGAQWGDEGKGKIVDILTEKMDATVRFQGGNNAGHTLVIGKEKIILHLIPSGILRQNNLCFIAQGVVLNLKALIEEINSLKHTGIDVYSKLKISANCPLILDSHIALDKAREIKNGKNLTIGTTCRGIGPAYEDRAARRSIRLGELFSLNAKEKITALVDYHNFLLTQYHQSQSVDAQKVFDDLNQLKQLIKPLVCDAGYELNALIKNKKSVLFEGAQGVLLDIDLGTYPFVTSSNTVSGAVYSGSGLGIFPIDNVLGITKAYTTRVGSGPFPTEIFDDRAKTISTKGQEVGATTGRARRCGWLDLVALKYSIDICGINQLALTKVDVLDEFNTIEVCTSYEINNKNYSYPPFGCWSQEIKPVYEKLEGWGVNTFGIKTKKDIPAQLNNYIKFIENFVGIQVKILSTGPDRTHTITF